MQTREQCRRPARSWPRDVTGRGDALTGDFVAREEERSYKKICRGGQGAWGRSVGVEKEAGRGMVRLGVERGDGRGRRREREERLSTGYVWKVSCIGDDQASREGSQWSYKGRTL